MACGCSGSSARNTNRAINKNTRGIVNNVSRSVPIMATNEERIDAERVKFPELFQKVIYHNGKEYTHAVSYNRGLAKYGIRTYTSNKFRGDKELYMLKEDVAKTPKNKVTVVEEALAVVEIPKPINREVSLDEDEDNDLPDIDNRYPVSASVLEAIEKPKRQYKKSVKKTEE